MTSEFAQTTPSLTVSRHQGGVTNSDDQNDELMLLIGIVIAIVVLLLILIIVLFWQRSKLKLLFKANNKPIVVRMMACKQSRRNAVISQTFENSCIEDWKSLNTGNSKFYTVNLEEPSVIYSNSNCTQQPVGLDLDRYVESGDRLSALNKQDHHHYQTPTSVILQPLETGYETVRKFRPRAEQIRGRDSEDASKTIEIVKSSHQRIKQKKTSQSEIEFTYAKEEISQYNRSADVKNQQHYQTPNNNAKLVKPYEVITLHKAMPEADEKEVSKLNNILGDLDKIYSKSKQRRISEHYSQVLSPRINSETIPVCIYAEKDGKYYYPGFVMKVDDDGSLDESSDEPFYFSTQGDEYSVPTKQ